jgi:hypothetical protein
MPQADTSVITRNPERKDPAVPAIAFAAPLLPGKTETDRLAMQSCWQGERHAAYQDARRRAGITRESVWIQPAPQGDLAIVYLEADDLGAAFKLIGTSDEPFDRWFRDHVRDVHGLSLEEGFPPPEQILDLDANGT